MICKECLSQFEPIDLECVCKGCSRPQKERTLCLDCQRWKRRDPHFRLNHRALFTYNEIAKEYMTAFKFQGDLVLAELFAGQLGEILKPYQKTHHIVPVPISEESKQVRGFNQVNLMLEKAGIDYKEWLIHIGKGQRQSTKNRKERLLSKQFLAVDSEIIQAKQLNKPILIIDDVYTTGRTMLHAKKALALLESSTEKRVKIDSFSLFR